MAAKPRYVLDAGPLIEIRLNYPATLKADLLARILSISSEGRLCSVREVLRELGSKDDDLHAWASTNRELFVNPNDEELLLVKDIVRRFPSLVDAEKEIPQADPFVISRAVYLSRQPAADLFASGEVIVITQERPKIRKVNVPSVCDHFGIRHVNLLEWLDVEGIRLGILEE